MNWRIVAVAALGAATAAAAQQPFDLDPTFRTTINRIHVSDLIERPDGKLIISGGLTLPGDIGSMPGHYCALLHPDGSLADAYEGGSNPVFYMYGKLTEWQDRVYSSSGSRRNFRDSGLADTAYSILTHSPWFSFLQPGDYHVYPDGSVLISGYYPINDSMLGLGGTAHQYYSLVWFTNNGTFDPTRPPRLSDGAILTFQEMPDGKFMCNGGGGNVQGRPVSTIFRVGPDGILDTTFNAPHVDYGNVYRFYAQADGKVICGGHISFVGDQDTIALFRLLPDGSLDPTFNDQLSVWTSYRPWDHAGPVRDIQPIGPDKLVITGYFDEVDGTARGGIAMLDTAGNLLSGYFEEEGCGGYWDQPNPNFPPDPTQYYKSIASIKPSLDGNSYYIWGAYHGYNDGTTNDTLQRMVSRLHGLNVGVEEVEVPVERPLTIYPNPASLYATLAYDLKAAPDKAYLSIRDAVGKEIQRLPVQAAEGQTVWDTRSISPGAYTVELVNGGRTLGTAKLIVKR